MKATELENQEQQFICDIMNFATDVGVVLTTKNIKYINIPEFIKIAQSELIQCTLTTQGRQKIETIINNLNK